MNVSEIKDARCYFDWYIVKFSTLTEIVEVLQYTYLFGSRCIGVAFREFKKENENWSKRADKYALSF